MISVEQEMDFGFFTVFYFLLELDLEQDFGLQEFELEQEMKNGDKTEIHFLLDRNAVCVRSRLELR